MTRRLSVAALDRDCGSLWQRSSGPTIWPDATMENEATAHGHVGTM